MKYKVMIVEDQTMPRELFELRIQASERFEVALSRAAARVGWTQRSESSVPSRR